MQLLSIAGGALLAFLQLMALDAPLPASHSPTSARVRCSWLGVLLLAALGSGCGSDDAMESGDTDAGGETDSDDAGETDTDAQSELPEEVRAAAAEHAELYCAEELNCACPGTSPFEDLESCRANQLPIREEHFAQALAAGLTFDAGCFQAALEQYHSLGTCGGSIQDFFNGECYECPYFYGDADVGESCDRVRTWGSCRPGLACGSEREDDPGTCIDICEPGGVGRRCFSDRECDEGLSCQYNENIEGGAGSGICVAAPGLGQPCLDLECADDLVCGFDEVCVSPVPLGEACSPGECEDGLYCSEERTCVAHATEGENCEVTPCLPSLSCDRTDPDQPTCRMPAGIGEPCMIDGDCIEQLCDDGICQDPENWCPGAD